MGWKDRERKSRIQCNAVWFSLEPVLVPCPSPHPLFQPIGTHTMGMWPESGHLIHLWPIGIHALAMWLGESQICPPQEKIQVLWERSGHIFSSSHKLGFSWALRGVAGSVLQLANSVYMGYGGTKSRLYLSITSLQLLPPIWHLARRYAYFF